MVRPGIWIGGEELLNHSLAEHVQPELGPDKKIHRVLAQATFERTCHRLLDLVRQGAVQAETRALRNLDSYGISCRLRSDRAFDEPALWCGERRCGCLLNLLLKVGKSEVIRVRPSRPALDAWPLSVALSR
jgi:hypothetical protein